MSESKRSEAAEERAAKKAKTEEPSLKIKKLDEDAIVPVRKSKGAAGYDLASPITTVIPPHTIQKIDLKIACAIPEGFCGKIATRSSVNLKQITIEGVVDSDYRGSVGLMVNNQSDSALEVYRGDRLAQLILEKITTPEVEVVDDLDETERGEGGFGSTGVGSGKASA